MYKYFIKTAILAVAGVSAAFASTSDAADISKLDKNFVSEKVEGLDVVYRNALESPFVLEGFPWRLKDASGVALYRLPRALAAGDVGSGVLELAKHTAGGVVRFRTNSRHIVLRAEIQRLNPNLGHMPAAGSSGFDVFRNRTVHIKTINPANWESRIPSPLVAVVCKSAPAEMCDYTIYLPLYNGLRSLEIGLVPNAKIETPTPHKIGKPILFYGSSITQGGCASRTSNAYAAMLCRELDAPMINLGFSGNAKGEPKIAELIASLDLSAFVYDYDYNAPSVGHLKNTHEPFFKLIRKARPNLPIVMLGRITNAEPERDKIVRKTYENALESGDKKVWYVDGQKLLSGADISYLTVDNCHPNDLGFFLMFKNSLPVLKRALNAR